MLNVVGSIYAIRVARMSIKKQKEEPTEKKQKNWIIAKLKTPMTTAELVQDWGNALTSGNNEAISSSLPPPPPSPSHLQDLIGKLSSEYRVINKDGKWKSY
jgi:hypothetical protein